MLMSHSEFSVRSANPDDVPRLVDIDVTSFHSVYADYPGGTNALRDELSEKFAHRLELLGGNWISVLEHNGQLAGLMMSCPTEKTPESFVSWEDTTDNGTLDTTYSPDGKNAYVVTLSVLPQASRAKEMLFVHQVGQGIKMGIEQYFFESRVPGLRAWTKREANRSGLDFISLEREQIHDFAEQYFQFTRTINGEEVPFDNLLRLYKRVGCELLKLVPDAYQDAPSMNYGVLCTYNLTDRLGEILPSKVARLKSARHAAGTLIRLAAHSEHLSHKMLE